MGYYRPVWEILPGFGVYDIVTVAILAFFLFLLAFYRSAVNPFTSANRRVYLSAFVARLFSGLAFGVIYNYYYVGGDTFMYYDISQSFRQAILDNPFIGIKLLFMETGEYSDDTFQYTSAIWTVYFQREVVETVFFAKLLAVCELPFFRSYWALTVLLSSLSFFASWSLYRTTAQLYPRAKQILLIGIVFLPSTLFWTSGILKDTVTFAGLCIILKTVLELLHYRRTSILGLILSIILFRFVFLLKAYVVLPLLGPIAIAVFMQFKPSSSIAILKYLALPVVLLAVLALSTVATVQLGNISAEYQLSQLQDKAEGYRTYHQFLAEKEGQSFYSLGDVSYTPLGILRKSPAAMNVTFFRPYLWEAREPFQVMSALESFLMLLFVLFTFRKIGFFKTLNYFRTDAVALMLLSYSLIFATMVGLTAYNFGALVRFKVPGVMTLLVCIAIVHHLHREEEANAALEEAEFE